MTNGETMNKMLDNDGEYQAWLSERERIEREEMMEDGFYVSQCDDYEDGCFERSGGDLRW